jgi:choline dehydrogenase-like flavoprotein
MAQLERFENLILGSGKGGKLLAWDMARSGRRTAVVERRGCQAAHKYRGGRRDGGRGRSSTSAALASGRKGYARGAGDQLRPWRPSWAVHHGAGG